MQSYKPEIEECSNEQYQGKLACYTQGHVFTAKQHKEVGERSILLEHSEHVLFQQTPDKHYKCF
jgi:hypothetical protein